VRGILHPYGPLMTTLRKIGDLVILNFLMLLFSLPVVTIGAAWTAGHFAALKILRNEDKILRDFWDSFRENFKQATVIWLGMLLVIGVGVLGIWYFGQSVKMIAACILALLLLVFFVGLWVFPVLSKFVNTTVNTVSNAVILAFRHIFRTVAMLVSYFLLPATLMFSFELLPVVLLYGMSLPVWLGACLYNRVFASMEEEVLDNQQNCA